MEMSSQRVLITGGTRGIGRELAVALTRRGAAVAVCGRSDPDRAELPDLGTEALYFQCDLSNEDEIQGLASRVRARLRPTVLINNAGVQFNHDWPETDASDRDAWSRMETHLNLVAPVRLTALLLDDLLAEKRAAVVNITSILSLCPKRTAPVYSASKAGLRAFTRGLRYQLQPHSHVRVVEVLPPVVDTGMTAGRGSAKMDPADVAEEIVRGLERDKDEIWIGKARLIRALQRVAPGMVARILRDA